MAERRSGLTVPAGILQPTMPLEDSPVDEGQGEARDEGQSLKTGPEPPVRTRSRRRPAPGKWRAGSSICRRTFTSASGCWPTSEARNSPSGGGGPGQGPPQVERGPDRLREVSVQTETRLPRDLALRGPAFTRPL